MSALCVPAERRHWVFSTLRELMSDRGPPVRIILDLKGPEEAASIRWYPIQPVFRGTDKRQTWPERVAQTPVDVSSQSR